MRYLYSVIMVAVLPFVMFGCAGISTKADVQDVKMSAEAGDNDAVIKLVNALRSDKKEVRDSAYEALISVGSPAVPELIKTLSDPDPDVREYAAGALGNIGDKRAEKPLMDMLKKDEERRYVAAWALGEMDAREAVGLLVQMLAVHNDALQKESTRALIKIGENSVDALIAALKSPDRDTRKFASRALGVIKDNKAEPALIEALKDPDDQVSAAAALALGTAGTKEAIRPLMDSLDHGNFMTRINASISLGQLEATDAVGKLETIMKDDKNPYVREWSARALENITGNRYKYRNESGDLVYPYNLYR